MENPTFRNCMKDIKVDIHFVHDKEGAWYLIYFFQGSDFQYFHQSLSHITTYSGNKATKSSFLTMSELRGCDKVIRIILGDNELS